MAGRVVHFEVPFDDVERATGFYRDVFGWQIQSVPDLDYHMVMSGPVGAEGMPTEPGYINGGMFARAPQFPATPVITIDVDDIDACLAQIEASGGATVEKKIPVGEMGFAAYFKDPEGNVMGLWQSAPG
jgi:predicted enzyme related to lactoylglutathione lyase